MKEDKQHKNLMHEADKEIKRLEVKIKELKKLNKQMEKLINEI